MTRPSDAQRAVLDGLAAGRRLVGPVEIVRPMSGRRTRWREMRRWGWADGPASSAGTVHAHSVASLAARGLIRIEDGGSRREARLVAPTPNVHPSPFSRGRAAKPVGGDGRASKPSTDGPLPPSSGWSPSPVPGEDGALSGAGLGAG